MGAGPPKSSTSTSEEHMRISTRLANRYPVRIRIKLPHKHPKLGAITKEDREGERDDGWGEKEREKEKEDASQAPTPDRNAKDESNASVTSVHRLIRLAELFFFFALLILAVVVCFVVRQVWRRFLPKSR